MINTSDKWYRIICSNCKNGTLFFTKQVPELGCKPVYEYAIFNDFEPANQVVIPRCDNCGSTMFKKLFPFYTPNTHSQHVEDVEIVEDKCIENLLNKIQEGRDDFQR